MVVPTNGFSGCHTHPGSCPKFAYLTNCEMTKFWSNLPFPKVYANFSGLAGGRSLVLAAPCGRHVACRDGSVLPSKQYYSRPRASKHDR